MSYLIVARTALTTRNGIMGSSFVRESRRPIQHTIHSKIRQDIARQTALKKKADNRYDLLVKIAQMASSTRTTTS